MVTCGLTLCYHGNMIYHGNIQVKCWLQYCIFNLQVVNNNGTDLEHHLVNSGYHGNLQVVDNNCTDLAHHLILLSIQSNVKRDHSQTETECQTQMNVVCRVSPHFPGKKGS